MTRRTRPEVICRLRSLEEYQRRLDARWSWGWFETVVTLAALAGVVMALWK